MRRQSLLYHRTDFCVRPRKRFLICEEANQAGNHELIINERENANSDCKQLIQQLVRQFIQHRGNICTSYLAYGDSKCKCGCLRELHSAISSDQPNAKGSKEYLQNRSFCSSLYCLPNQPQASVLTQIVNICIKFQVSSGVAHTWVANLIFTKILPLYKITHQDHRICLENKKLINKSVLMHWATASVLKV